MHHLINSSFFKLLLIGIFFSTLSCNYVFESSSTVRYECPCGGFGKVAQGSIITIEEKNPGDIDSIIDAVEKKLGGECCEIEENNYDMAY